MADCLIDAGNSRLKLARREATGWQVLGAFDFDDPHSVDRCLAVLAEPGFERVVLASVSKGWREERLGHLLSRLRLPVTRIESMAALGRLRIAYPQPRQLGVDRFLALLAASESADNAVLLSFGSALTLDVLAADGRHHGGLIAPSPDFQLHSMREHFPGLFEAEGRARGLADNTADALATGIRHQVLGLVQRVMAEAFEGAPARLLVTGGGAEAWLPVLPGAPEHAPDILFHGMLRYLELSGL